MCSSDLSKVLIPRTWCLLKSIERLIKLVDMVREVGVLEPRGLLNEHQLFEGTIKKVTFNIHLLQSKVIMGCISKKDTDGLKASHGSIGLSKINAFNLRVALSHQSSLVPHNHAMFILLVLENPFCANNIAALLWLLK